MKKILIIQTASIGDVILATSVVESLHSHFEKCQIDILVKKQNAELFINHPIINQTITLDRENNKIFEIFRLLKKIRSVKYDICINIQRFFTSGLLTAFSASKTKVGFNKNPFSFLFNYSVPHLFDGQHEIMRNNELLSFLKIKNFKLPKLYPADNDIKNTLNLKTEKYICIAPTSLWFTKQFPIEKWIEFVDNISNEIKIYITGAKNDFQISEQIIKSSRNKNIFNLCGKLSLLETASLMKNSIINYTNDSAAMHLSSAVDANVCAIFCSTIKEFGFGPLSKNSYIVETKEKLNCRPCGIHGLNKCPESHFKCAYSIKIEQLIEPLNQII